MKHFQINVLFIVYIIILFKKGGGGGQKRPLNVKIVSEIFCENSSVNIAASFSLKNLKYWKITILEVLEISPLNIHLIY